MNAGQKVLSMPQDIPPPTVLLNAHWQVLVTPLGQRALELDLITATLTSSRFILRKLEEGEFINADGSVPSLMICTLAGEVVKANAVIQDRAKLGLLYLCHIPKGARAPKSDAGIRSFMRLRGMAI